MPQRAWIGCDLPPCAQELGDAFLIYARTGRHHSDWLVAYFIDHHTLVIDHHIWLLAGEGRGDVSLFILEKGTPGFSLGQRIKDKCGMRASNTAELVFEDVVLPASALVGNEGDAMLHMMRNLELERVVLAAMSLGIAKRSVQLMSSYAQERKSFGEPINRFGQIQKHIADSYAEYMAGKTYTYNVANNLALDATGGRVDSDGVKLYCSVMGTTVANRAMQVMGGYGYCGEYQVERLWRDAKLLEIGGGTLEAHQKNMTRDMTRMTDF